jgi:hypothetical protein
LDNYLKVSSKLYNLRRFLEGSQGDMFERKMYLKMLELEDDLKITQCYNCAEYSFLIDTKQVNSGQGGIDFYCRFCKPE